MSLRDQLLAAGLVSQKQVRDAERQQQHQERSQQQSKQKRRPPQQDPGSGGAGHGPSANAAPRNAAPGHADTGKPQGAHAASAGSAAGAMSVNGAGRNGATHAGQGRSALNGTAPSAAVRQAAAQSAKVARDLALNKKQQERAQQKARAAQIKQLIEQNRVARGQTEERYNFVDGGRVRFIAANAEIRGRLVAGELFIVRHDGVYEVVPAAIAARIRERDERAVIVAGAAPAASPPVDDPYKDFAVPDDLMW